MEACALIDRETGASVTLARFATFNLPFAQGGAPESRSAYDDLIGPNIAAVMARVGWHYEGSMTRVDAFLSATGTSGSKASRVVASGWAGPIRTKDGSLGINASYGVGANHRGAGLGRLLAYCAVAECLAQQAFAGEAIPTFVNIQARASNGASLAVARSLGVPDCEDAAFVVPENGLRIDYMGFREPIQDFLARGLARVKARLPDYEPGSFTAARMRLTSDLSAGLDLLGWLTNDISERPETGTDPENRLSGG